MSRFYTGVGSRQTPSAICDLMEAIAIQLSDRRYVLRSGGAEGADIAFQIGADWELREIYIPWPGFGQLTKAHPGVIELGQLALSDHAERMASAIHPAWARCSTAAKKLHARNAFQVMGRDLATPSKFLICWTPKGEPVGGTATAIRLAEQAGIPVFNLGLDPHRERLERFVGWTN